MIDKVKTLLTDLESSIHNIKYFKHHGDKSAGFCDILVFSYLQTIFNNIPQSQLVRIKLSANNAFLNLALTLFAAKNNILENNIEYIGERD